MNPLVGLQSGWFPNTPQVPQQGLMGGQQPQPQPSLPSLMNATPGDWSQVAYQMAGSPKQGGLYPSVAPPPTLPGSTGSTSSSGGSALGGIATGILGALAKNPSLLNSLGSSVSNLFGSSAPSISQILGGATIPASAMTPVGVDAVSELPSVTAAVDAGAAPTGGLLGEGATAYGTDAGVAPASALSDAAPAASGGLMGASPLAGGTALAGGAGAVGSTAGALGAGAPGVFASGSAAAGSGGAAAGAAGASSLGAAGLALPIGIAAAGLMMGDALTAKNTQGNAAMTDWMKATGATWKPNPGQSNSGGNTFQSQQFSSASNPGTMIGSNGQPMTPTQVVNAISAWAKQNGVNPGDFHPV